MSSSFVANGKKYRHTERHKCNSRKINQDIYLESFRERMNRDMTKEEHQIFQTAYNIGYKEGRKRYLKIESSDKDPNTQEKN